MRIARFTIADLVRAVLLCAVAMAGLMFASTPWGASALSVALAALTLAVLGIIYRRAERRAFWTGVVLCGWAYLTTSSGPWFIDNVRPKLLTSRILEWAYPLLIPPNRQASRSNSLPTRAACSASSSPATAGPWSPAARTTRPASGTSPPPRPRRPSPAIPTMSTRSTSRDERTLLTGCRDASAVLWDVETGQLKGNIPGNKASIEVVRYSPDGTIFAVAGWDWIVDIWDVATGRKLNVLRSPGGGILALGFSPDGKYLLAGTEKGLLRMWDVRTWRVMGTIPAHQGNIRAISFSPDGKLFATASHDWTVKVWKMPMASAAGGMRAKAARRLAALSSGCAFAVHCAFLDAAGTESVASP